MVKKSMFYTKKEKKAKYDFEKSSLNWWIMQCFIKLLNMFENIGILT